MRAQLNGILIVTAKQMAGHKRDVMTRKIGPILHEEPVGKMIGGLRNGAKHLSKRN